MRGMENFKGVGRRSTVLYLGFKGVGLHSFYGVVKGENHLHVLVPSHGPFTNKYCFTLQKKVKKENM